MVHEIGEYIGEFFVLIIIVDAQFADQCGFCRVPLRSRDAADRVGLHKYRQEEILFQDKPAVVAGAPQYLLTISPTIAV